MLKSISNTFIKPEIIKIVENKLSEKEYYYKNELLRGWLFENNKQNSAIIIDYQICNNELPYEYSYYTKEQNYIMHHFDSTYRFIIENEHDFSNFLNQIEIFENRNFYDYEIKSYGKNRNLVEIDPTVTEAYFERAFIELYGYDALNSVLREEPIIDINSSTRYIDYLVHTKNHRIAIEKNGESYHHPIIIGKEKYQNQLIKQNSLVAYGMKIYRWSIQGMKAKENFYEELKVFIGDKSNLIATPKLKMTRKIKLFEHQQIKLSEINESRKNGEKNFLVILPTGTGKTEIMISDMISQYKEKKLIKALVLVHSINRKNITIKDLNDRFIAENITNVNISSSYDADIVVSTYAGISRNYYDFANDYFKYIVVDEAHHAVAPILQKVIQYFNPLTLLGLTATPDRPDEKKLSDIFGQYEETMTLKEAIDNNLLVPIKAYRIITNIDLSTVRYNGKDYYSTDIEKTIFVPSRDALIVMELKKYFYETKIGFKSGIIFCVSIQHAENLAKKMRDVGFKCKAVSGKDKNSEKYIEEYQNGKIQFLTTCSLLNEGWDSPRTSIIVLARPTMSKVLYTQQIGRGTRKMEGKEALYVIDIVDNYGAYGRISNKPWSIHSLLGISEYMPFADILHKNITSIPYEEKILVELFEETRKLEPIDIFTFEQVYSDYLSDEQLARELFISTSTVKNWVDNEKIIPDLILPMGKYKLNYYHPQKIEEIRLKMNLPEHNETTIYEDFYNFLNERDYTFSYKIIFLLSFIKIVDLNGECNLDELINEYSVFYLDRIHNNQLVDKDNCPYNENYINDKVKVKRSIMNNPFEKFERKNFMHFCKDLNYIMFSSFLWEKIKNEDELMNIKMQLFVDLENYYKKLNSTIDSLKWKEYWKIL